MSEHAQQFEEKARGFLIIESQLQYLQEEKMEVVTSDRQQVQKLGRVDAGTIDLESSVCGARRITATYLIHQLD